MESHFFVWVIQHRSCREIVARLVDVFFGWWVRLISFITIRNKRKWVIGNKTGWADNSKYLMIFLSRDNPEGIRLIWIGKKADEVSVVRQNGFEAYRKWSLPGLYHALTAAAYFFSSDVSDINYWASGRALKINMWHGVGLKKLGMKGSVLYNPKDWKTHIFTPHIYDSPTYFVGPSPMMARHFSDCYRLTDSQILQVGYPRCDLLQHDAEYVEEHIRHFESEEMLSLYQTLGKYNKVYVYMPTFRDDQRDFIASAGIDFMKLNELLRSKNYFLLLKFHPATRICTMDIKGLSNMLLMDKRLDIYPLLPKTDVLITDYSSIYYDYILMRRKGVILFPFDYSEYIENSRDFAFDYMTYTPGVKAWNFDELYAIIESERGLDFPERDDIIRKFWGDDFGHASDRIKTAALNRLREDRKRRSEKR